MNNIILDQYDNQKLRGQEGFGVYDGEHDHLVKAASEDRILNWLCKEKNNSTLLMFHHRWPTSTVNVRRAAHPFTTKDYFGDTEYILIHNGVINNAGARFEVHQELGIEYQSLLEDLTFNDSEALLWDVALYLEGKQEKIVATGRVAFICMKLEHGIPTKLYFARNSSPLNFYRGDDGIMLSSEGEGEEVPENTLHTYNYALKRLTTKKLYLPQFVTTQRDYSHMPLLPYNSNNACDTGNYWDGDDYVEDYYEFEDAELDPLTGFYRMRDKFNRTISSVIHFKSQEIEQRALAYLLGSQGNFDAAYFMAENDYFDALDDADITGDTYEADLLESVLEVIENDPENQNEQSVSSKYTELELAR